MASASIAKTKRIQCAANTAQFHRSSMAVQIESVCRKQAPSSRLGYRLVVVFLSEQVSSGHNAERIDQQGCPTDGAENPRFVQLPANEEVVVVVIQVGLQSHQHPGYLASHFARSIWWEDAPQEPSQCIVPPQPTIVRGPVSSTCKPKHTIVSN